jgi:hypothetical protein
MIIEQRLCINEVGGSLLQGMGVAFSSVVSCAENNDVVLCCVEACKCLHTIFILPRFPPALGVFESMVTLT